MDFHEIYKGKGGAVWLRRNNEWLKELLTAAGWIILTKDAKIRYRYSESSLVMNTDGRLFVVLAKGMNGPQMATMVVAALPAIHQFLATHPAPFIAKIKRPRTVELWVDAQES